MENTVKRCYILVRTENNQFYTVKACEDKHVFAYALDFIVFKEVENGKMHLARCISDKFNFTDEEACDYALAAEAPIIEAEISYVSF